MRVATRAPAVCVTVLAAPISPSAQDLSTTLGQILSAVTSVDAGYEVGSPASANGATSGSAA